MPFFTSAQINYNDFPSLDSVLNQYCSTYNVAPTSYLQFEKKPSGWWVSEKSYDNQEILKTEAFWDAEKGEFKETSFPKNENLNFNRGLNNQLKQRHIAHWFDANIFYGYVGWENDIINSFEKEKELKANELYALGRAYSSTASNFLFNNSGFANPENSFEFKPGGNSLSKSQLAKYINARKSAITYFEKVSQIDPDFETIVGAITTKASNGYLTGYVDLLIYQNKEEALKFLKDGLYDDYNISIAKNYLNSCPLNAFLFTYGDNDTYPLLYAQEQLGFRKDVKVINLGLLNNVAYMDMLKREGIAFKTNLSIFDDDARSFFQVNNQGFEVSIDELIELASDDKNVQDNNGTTVHTVYGDYYSVADLFSFRADKSYMTRSDLLLYDIINTNFWDRPICFGFSTGRLALAGLHNHCELIGYVFQLRPYEKIDYTAPGYIASPQLLFNKLTLELDWNGTKHVKSAEKTQLRYQRLIFYRLAQYYNDSTESDSAALVLSFANKVIPNEASPYEYYGVMFTKLLFEAGDKELANEIANETGVNIEAELNNLKATNQNPSFLLNQKEMLENIMRFYEQEE